MKKLLGYVVVMISIFIIGVGVAAAEDTSRGVYDVNVGTPAENEAVEEWLNSTDIVSHNHAIEEEAKFQRALELDVVLYENDYLRSLAGVEHNLTTDITVAKSKVELNLFNIVKKIIKK